MAALKHCTTAEEHKTEALRLIERSTDYSEYERDEHAYLQETFEDHRKAEEWKRENGMDATFIPWVDHYPRYDEWQATQMLDAAHHLRCARMLKDLEEI